MQAATQQHGTEADRFDPESGPGINRRLSTSALPSVGCQLKSIHMYWY